MTAKSIVTDVNPPAPAEQGNGDILSDLSAGGDAGVSAADLGPLSARPVRRISIQTLVVALVLVVSAAALYTMRRQGMGVGMKFKTPAMAPDIDKVHGKTTAA